MEENWYIWDGWQEVYELVASYPKDIIQHEIER